ncbi:MAG: TIGR01777 family oxidoreductase [Anaerolineae bacterium]|nr:TIGR01777 family oxidoreductase [Anaerolineae bacterium]
MRIIITGGTGLIGQALAAEWAGAGHEVIALSRAPAPAGMPAGVHVERWDARTVEGWGHLADGAGAIINLAGAGIADRRWTADRKRAIIESRQYAGEAVVAAVEAAANKPGVVVQASAVGYYGPRGSETLTEDSAPGNDFPAQVCIPWEASTKAVEAAGVRRVVVRLGAVLSAEGGALPRMCLPFKLFVGGPLGSGRQWFSWIHLADAVAAIRCLVETPGASGVYNLTAPNPLTNADFSRALGRVMNRPAWAPAPGFALRLLFGELAGMLLTGQRVVPQRLQMAGFRFRFEDAEAALRDLLR